MSNGKGSGRRPAVIDDATMTSNWDRVFGKKGKYPKLEPPAPPQPVVQYTPEWARHSPALLIQDECSIIHESVINRVITDRGETGETS